MIKLKKPQLKVEIEDGSEYSRNFISKNQKTIKLCKNTFQEIKKFSQPATGFPQPILSTKHPSLHSGCIVGKLVLVILVDSINTLIV